MTTALVAAGALDLGAYNYWLVIVLMMTGLYVVLARSNMIKTIIGLNMFQVAVILFYVSMGKVSGGTAPIEIKEMTDATKRSAQLLAETSGTGVVTDAQVAEAEAIVALTRTVLSDLPEGEASTRLDVGIVTDRESHGEAHEALHEPAELLGVTTVEQLLAEASTLSGAAAMDKRKEAIVVLDRTISTAVIYSNPLPHVLMLTAIVVGIATIALALALVVRINEAYDTIEEDEVLAQEAAV